MNKFRLLFMLLVVGRSAAAAPVLLCPEWCDCVATKESDSRDDIKFTCEWPYVPDVERLRFLIPPAQGNNVVRLSIKCRGDKAAAAVESTIDRGLFAHLHKLKHLHISSCPMVNGTLPDHFSDGLQGLKYLHLDGFSRLDISDRALSNLQHLEKLSIVEANVDKMPNLCQLRELKLLNLSHNNLQRLDKFPCDNSQLIIIDLSNNRLSKISNDALSSLKSLRVLKLDKNFIHEIHIHNPPQLTKLSLADNFLTDLDTLPAHLQIVDLSNNDLHIVPRALSQHTYVQQVNLRNNSIDAGTPFTLQASVRLTVLDLSYNKMHTLPARWLPAGLVSLDLRHNDVRSIDQHGALDNLSRLEQLTLDHNRIHSLTGTSLPPALARLKRLSLRNCGLAKIDRRAFTHLAELEVLDLSANLLIDLPQSMVYLKGLVQLNLSSNSITTTSKYPFSELDNLRYIDLSNNNINAVNRFTFDRMPKLDSLNLSNNAIQTVEPGSFDGSDNLRLLDIGRNWIRDINGVLANLNRLRVLNVSHNQLLHVDLALLPPNLHTLDASYNSIGQVTNYFFTQIAGRAVDRLKMLDFSYNKLDRLTGDTLPNSTEVAVFVGNQIRMLDLDFLADKVNLSRLDVRNNLLETLHPPSAGHETWGSVQLTVAFNPLKCDCHLDWIKSFTPGGFRIGDLAQLTCTTERNPDEIRHVRNIDRSEFLCPYESHCSADCLCCDFESCDCKNVCPPNCTCLSDKRLTVNEVSCSSAWSDDPEGQLRFIPMHATQVRLDGLQFGRLRRNAFFGRFRLRKLYLNNSRVAHLSSKSFNGLTSLDTLDLSSNWLRSLNGSEFNLVPRLETLLLHNNRLTTLNTGAFDNLPNLKLLTLHGNKFHLLPHALANHRRPVSPAVTLGQNPWKCDCDPYRFEFPRWLIAHQTLVLDNKDVYCFENLTNPLSNFTTILSVLPPTEGVDVVKVNFWTFVLELNKTFCYPNTADVATMTTTPRSNSTTTTGSSSYPALLGPDTSMIFLLIALSAMVSFSMLTLVLWRLQRGRRLKNKNAAANIVAKYYDQYGDTSTMAAGDSSCSASAATAATYLTPPPPPALKYDAFVCYSTVDERFVLDILVPKLEKARKYRLCLLYKHFLKPVSADRQHVDNELIDAMERSHRILTVYSKSFVDLEWEQVRIRTAYQWLAHCKRQKSIVILLDDTRPTDHALAKYMRMNLCYRYGDDHQAVFWDNLLTALASIYYNCYYYSMDRRRRHDFDDHVTGAVRCTCDSASPSPYDTIDDDDVVVVSDDHNEAALKTNIVPSLLI